MSPEAIQSLIEMFGVEQGIHILNLFTAPEETRIPQTHRPQTHRPQTIKERPKELIREANFSPEITHG